MSRIALNGNPLGTGTFTIASPNSNSDRTVTLPDATGTLITNSGTEAVSFASVAVSGASTTGSLAVSGATTTSSLTVNNNAISAVNSLGFRNRLINSDMRIDQRNNGASVTPTVDAQYAGADRWSYFLTQPSRFSVQQNAGSVTPPAGFRNYLGITSLSAYTLTGNDNFEVVQKIEGFNTADLNWGTASAQSVTLSFWVRSSLTGTFGGGITNEAYNRSYPFTYTISAANTWEQKTITIPGDTSGTWMTNNGIGIVLQFALGATGARLGTAGAWATGWFPSATGAISVVSTNNATWQITGVQLEAGTVATPFERRDYGRELIMCQRYYYNGLQWIWGVFYNTTDALFPARFPVTMRAAPTVNFTSGATQAFDVSGLGPVNASTANIIFDRQTVNGFRMYTVSGSLGTRVVGAPVEFAGTTLQASAEL